MPPPPASTFLAFHPQDNNIIAIGMEDSTIHIYNVRVDEVISTNYLLFHICPFKIISLNIVLKTIFLLFSGKIKIEGSPEANNWFSFLY